jgi:hypothetical protein
MWIIDPKTKEKSVSLTFVVITSVLCCIAAGLEMAGVVKSTSILMELYMSSCGLYFGRKFTGTKGQVIEKE